MADQPSLPPKPTNPYPEPNPVEVSDAALTRSTRRAFLAWGMAGLTGGSAFWWLRTRSPIAGALWPLRRVHQANEQVSRALYSPTRMVREFPKSAAGEPIENGPFGQPQTPTQSILIECAGKPARTVSIAELIGGLPRVEMTTELMCIEGWSQVVTWGGVRFADAAVRLGCPIDAHAYVGMMTANGDYTVGLDAPSAMHPQTLLCDQMNGQALTFGHGAPLRLVIPAKYGIKNIKWLGRITFTDERPGDYWAERGYDWYAGL